MTIQNVLLEILGLFDKLSSTIEIAIMSVKILTKNAQNILRKFLLGDDGAIKKRISVEVDERYAYVLKGYPYPTIGLRVRIHNYVPISFKVKKVRIAIKEDGELGLCKILECRESGSEHVQKLGNDPYFVKRNRDNTYTLKIEIEPFAIMRYFNIKSDEQINYIITFSLYSMFVGELNIEKEQRVNTKDLILTKQKLKDILENFLKAPS